MASTRRGLASFSTWFSFPQVFLWGWSHAGNYLIRYKAECRFTSPVVGDHGSEDKMKAPGACT